MRVAFLGRSARRRAEHEGRRNKRGKKEQARLQAHDVNPLGRDCESRVLFFRGCATEQPICQGFYQLRIAGNPLLFASRPMSRCAKLEFSAASTTWVGWKANRSLAKLYLSSTPIPAEGRNCSGTRGTDSRRSVLRSALHTSFTIGNISSLPSGKQCKAAFPWSS